MRNEGVNSEERLSKNARRSPPGWDLVEVYLVASKLSRGNPGYTLVVGWSGSLLLFFGGTSGRLFRLIWLDASPKQIAQSE